MLNRGRANAAPPKKKKKTPAREYWSPCEVIAQAIKDPLGETTRELARSIRRYGFLTPCIFWPSRQVFVTGGARLAAAKFLLSEEPTFIAPHAPYGGAVPVRHQEFASDPDARAYAVADHPLTEHPAWDDALVDGVLTELAVLDEEHGISSWLVDGARRARANGSAQKHEPRKRPLPDDAQFALLQQQRPLVEVYSSAEDLAHMAWWAGQGFRFRPSPYSAEQKASAERALAAVVHELRGRVEYSAWPTVEEYRELFFNRFVPAWNVVHWHQWVQRCIVCGHRYYIHDEHARDKYCLDERCGARLRNRGREKIGRGKSAAHRAVLRQEKRFRTHLKRHKNCLPGCHRRDMILAGLAAAKRELPVYEDDWTYDPTDDLIERIDAAQRQEEEPGDSEES